MKETGESSENHAFWPHAGKLSEFGKSAMRNGFATEVTDNAPIHLVHRSRELRMDDLRSNSVYEKNGFTYRTDNRAPPMEVTGWLKLKAGPRTGLQTEIGHMGWEGDHGGHLIGTQFDGPTDAFNIRHQAAKLNQGAEWKAMEEEWAIAREEHHRVWVKIEPQYRGESIRPYKYVVSYEIGGIGSKRIFSNHAPIDV